MLLQFQIAWSDFADRSRSHGFVGQPPRVCLACQPKLRAKRARANGAGFRGPASDRARGAAAGTTSPRVILVPEEGIEPTLTVK